MIDEGMKLEAYILVPRDSAVRVAYRLNDWVAEQPPERLTAGTKLLPHRCKALCM